MKTLAESLLELIATISVTTSTAILIKQTYQNWGKVKLEDQCLNCKKYAIYIYGPIRPQTLIHGKFCSSDCYLSYYHSRDGKEEISGT